MNINMKENERVNFENPFSNKVIYDDMHELLARQDNISWMNNKIFFISGAYGMIASYFVFFLIYINEFVSDVNVIIVAQGRNQEKMRNRFGAFCDKEYFKMFDGNISCEISIDCKIDFIVHAASLASPHYYTSQPVDVITPNVLGTYYLLKMAQRHNASNFLFFSSGEVYGELKGKQLYDEKDFGKFDSMVVRNCYGESKRLGENLCAAFCQQYGVNTNVVRIGHTYGPTLDLQFDHRVIAEFVNCVINGTDIVMKSDGMAERMFCYIVDAIDGFLKIMEKGVSGEAYNMCNPTQLLKIKELAELLVKLQPEKCLNVITEEQSDISYVENPQIKTPIMSVEKLEQLGWKPMIDVEDGFRRTLQSFLY